MNKNKVLAKEVPYKGVLRRLSMQIMELETSYEILGEILKESSTDLTTDFGRGYLEGQMKVQLEQIRELENLKRLMLDDILNDELQEEQGEGLNE